MATSRRCKRGVFNDVDGEVIRSTRSDESERESGVECFCFVFLSFLFCLAVFPLSFFHSETKLSPRASRRRRSRRGGRLAGRARAARIQIKILVRTLSPLLISLSLSLAKKNYLVFLSLGPTPSPLSLSAPPPPPHPLFRSSQLDRSECSQAYAGACWRRFRLSEPKPPKDLCC